MIPRNKIKTSLIIPTLNRPADLSRCLQSIEQLEKKFDEIIIIEQGDINRTRKIVSKSSILNIRLFTKICG